TGRRRLLSNRCEVSEFVEEGRGKVMFCTGTFSTLWFIFFFKVPVLRKFGDKKVNAKCPGGDTEF
ncbi:MAG: hypothetical protein LBI90_08100, partial [Treponema sp.]|nr:hypothetical protein [Treponema sp.]